MISLSGFLHVHILIAHVQKIQRGMSKRLVMSLYWKRVPFTLASVRVEVWASSTKPRLRRTEDPDRVIFTLPSCMFPLVHALKSHGPWTCLLSVHYLPISHVRSLSSRGLHPQRLGHGLHKSHNLETVAPLLFCPVENFPNQGKQRIDCGMCL